MNDDMKDILERIWNEGCEAGRFAHLHVTTFRQWLAVPGREEYIMRLIRKALKQ